MLQYTTYLSVFNSIRQTFSFLHGILAENGHLHQHKSSALIKETQHWPGFKIAQKKKKCNFHLFSWGPFDSHSVRLPAPCCCCCFLRKSSHIRARQHSFKSTSRISNRVESSLLQQQQQQKTMRKTDVFGKLELRLVLLHCNRTLL